MLLGHQQAGKFPCFAAQRRSALQAASASCVAPSTNRKFAAGFVPSYSPQLCHVASTAPAHATETCASHALSNACSPVHLTRHGQDGHAHPVADRTGRIYDTAKTVIPGTCRSCFYEFSRACHEMADNAATANKTLTTRCTLACRAGLAWLHAFLRCGDTAYRGRSPSGKRFPEKLVTVIVLLWRWGRDTTFSAARGCCLAV